MSRVRRQVISAVLLAVTLAVSGCSDDASDPVDEDEPGLTPEDLPTAPQLTDSVGAADDVTVDACPVETGENEATGTVENPTDEPADYVITISWITDDNDVVGRGVTTVESLAPGDTADWSVTGSALPAGEYTCTTNVRRGSL